jgi:hypothetical protein
MKSLFDSTVKKEITDRFNNLTPETKPVWGKMSVAQMIAHCQRPLLVSFGELTLKRSFLGLLLGAMVKKSLMKDKPMGINLPTHPKFIVKDDRYFEHERETLLKMVDRFLPDALTKDPHPLFGKMTEHEWDVLQWKHLDHHLRQFGV